MYPLTTVIVISLIDIIIEFLECLLMYIIWLYFILDI